MMIDDFKYSEHPPKQVLSEDKGRVEYRIAYNQFWEHFDITEKPKPCR